MKNISVLIKPASSLCNLRCRYCFYIDESEKREEASHGVMSEEMMDCLIERIAEALHQEGVANISFQGGEPTVAGLDYFRHFVSKMQEYPQIEVHYSLQTNGTLLNEEWSAFFAEHRFLIGVSLDGYESNMNDFRYDIQKIGVYTKVMRGIDFLEKANVEYNILTVVTKNLARHGKALVGFYRSHKFRYVQLIPCLPPLDATQEDDMSLTPELYDTFYLDFFREWKKLVLKGEVISVNLFENLMSMLYGYPPYQCGMIGKCIPQYVIESNGDVYPCDFYCLDEYRLGNIQKSSFEELRGNAGTFLATSTCTKKPCESCRFVNMCNGGCRRQNVCYLDEDTCAYQKVLLKILPELYELLQRKKVQ